MKRYVFSHSNNKRHFCLDSFFNGTGCLMSGNIYPSSVWLEFLHGLNTSLA